MTTKTTKLLTLMALASCASAFSPLHATEMTQLQLTQLTEQAQYENVSAIKRTLAQKIAANYTMIAPALKQQLSQYNLVFNPQALHTLSANIPLELSQANQALHHLKGLPSQTGDLLQLRLAHSDMLVEWQQGQAPLFAFAPQGNDKHWTHIEAFDQFGQIHTLDVNELPTQPTFIIELDQHKTQQAGLAVMKNIFAANHSQTEQLQMTPQGDAEPLSTSVLNKIRLNNDQEPWISGKAEVYGIVTGIDPSRDQPILDVIDLPYLDYDGTDYHPNQVIIHWQRYRWQAVDLLLMEQDDNTNYKTLASKLLDIVVQIMRTIPDPQVQGYAIIPQLTNELLKAMPDGWFTNDDDYVDVFYTLFEGRQYQGHRGASSNATITLTPLMINPR
ncbi:hypothetical protein PULV_a2793 [Pseudoalteromonas ulvae UL12]|uniref:DUF3103 family protein n=1 Tax=Pseudoalteromonas ulvae TaxID=107327 RepID=UPI00186B8B48|nr:DUF3103 family protein [Pseudoalteromonas ulvae]MBE0364453.1 hypothetical protein [Pseudoalteromonas ulvae UL12]